MTKETLELAAQLYVLAIQELINEQVENIRCNLPVRPLAISGPQPQRLNAIRAALQAAEERGLHRAIVIVNRHVDSEKGAARACAQTIVEELRAEQAANEDG
jgi:hypothetical protein